MFRRADVHYNRFLYRSAQQAIETWQHVVRLHRRQGTFVSSILQSCWTFTLRIADEKAARHVQRKTSQLARQCFSIWHDVSADRIESRHLLDKAALHCTFRSRRCAIG